MRITILLLFLAVNFSGFSQEEKPFETNVVINQHIEGSLLLPGSGQSDYLVIIIAGSGPTDRDGNQNFLKSNNLKKLAQGVAKEGIASFRYDKRIIKQMKERTLSEESIRFDEFTTDAIAVTDFFIKGEHFN